MTNKIVNRRPFLLLRTILLESLLPNLAKLGVHAEMANEFITRRHPSRNYSYKSEMTICITTRTSHRSKSWVESSHKSTALKYFRSVHNLGHFHSPKPRTMSHTVTTSIRNNNNIDGWQVSESNKITSSTGSGKFRLSTKYCEHEIYTKEIHVRENCSQNEKSKPKPIKLELNVISLLQHKWLSPW